MRGRTNWALVLFLLGISTVSRSRAAEAEAISPGVVPGGYLEVYYGYNFARPSNGITNFRAFDNRSSTVTLANAVLSADARAHRFFARVALQAGSTAETYYAAEPPRPGADGAAAGGPDVFKHLQEAYAGVDLSPNVELEAGLYLSPIGPEAMAIKDTWLWSRSNLFYGLPFYHTGARVKLTPAKGVTLRVGILNGWNSVIDNNDTPSFSAKATLELSPNVTLDAHYLGGIERNPGAPEGPAWRSLLDAFLTWHVHERLDLIVNSDGGVEPNRLGLAGWAAGAIFGRLRISDLMHVAVRSDLVMEKLAHSALGTSSPMLFPTRWLTSHAIAIGARPVEQASLRLEYRHDSSADPIFFNGSIAGSGTASDPFVPNARSQSTLTLGMTAWF
jgi:hypothetical protein